MMRGTAAGVASVQGLWASWLAHQGGAHQVAAGESMLAGMSAQVRSCCASSSSAMISAASTSGAAGASAAGAGLRRQHLQQRLFQLAKQQQGPLMGMCASSSVSAPTSLMLLRHASSSTSSLGSRLFGTLSSKASYAIKLQASAAWQRHHTKLYALGAVAATYMVWRLLFKLAGSFINATESVAEFGFMGLAITVVAAFAAYLRWYFGVNANAVYRSAMLRLNSNPGVLEVMGAPLAGSDLRAYVITGGGISFSARTLQPKLRPRRIQMIFPLQGAERTGLVSVEAKRKQGRYIYKLLAVDVKPSAMDSPGSPALRATGARLYIEGDASIYDRGSVLSTLRDPFLNAVSIQKDFDKEEEQEEEEAAALRALGGPGAAGGWRARLGGLLESGGMSKDSLPFLRSPKQAPDANPATTTAVAAAPEAEASKAAGEGTGGERKEGAGGSGKGGKAA